MTGAHETREQLGGLEVGRRASAGVLVEQRSLPAREHALGARRSVVVDLLDRKPAQLARELAGIADGRAREAERRVRAVVLAHAPQPPEHGRDVTAEDPALRVELVDDDVAQPHHERRPALVRRQDPDVQHVGIRQHDVGVLARPRTVVGARVAVEGDRAQSGDEPRSQRAQLVVRERLGREDQQRGVAPVVDHRLDDRHLVAQGLPGGRAGRDRDARTGAEPVDRGGLVRVEAVDPRAATRPKTSAGSGTARSANWAAAPEGSRGARAGRRARGRLRARRVWRTRPSGARVPTACDARVVVRCRRLARADGKAVPSANASATGESASSLRG